jgi:hypothetical protein
MQPVRTPQLKPFASQKRSTEPDTLETLQRQYDNLAARLEAVGAPADDRNILERGLNLNQDQKFLGNLFEVLNRPVQTVKGGIIGALEGDLLGGAWQGLSGQRELTGLDVQKELGLITEQDIENMGGFESFVRNITTDLLLDPLFYIPAGTFIKGFKKLTTKQKTIVSQASESAISIKGKTVMAQLNDEAAKLMTTINPATKANYTREAALQAARKKLKVLDTVEIDDLVRETDRVKDIYRKNYGEAKLQEIIDRVAKKGEKLTFSSDGGFVEAKRGLGFTAEDFEIYSLFEMDSELRKMAQQLGVNVDYKVVSTGLSSSGVPDLQVYAKYGDDWIQMAATEVKKSYSRGAAKGAFASGKSITLQKSADNVISIANGSTLSDSGRQILEAKFSGLRTSKGATVTEVINSIIDGGDNIAKSVTFNKAGFLEAGDAKLLEDAARELLKDQGWDYMKIVARDGTENLVHFADIIDNLKIKVAFGKKGTGKVGEVAARAVKGKEKVRQSRLSIDIALDTASDTKSAWDDLGRQIFGAPSTEVSRTVDIGLLSWLGEGDSFIAKPAKYMSDLLFNLRVKFKFGAGMGEDALSEFYRISGESRQIIYQKNRRLMSLSEEAVRRSPNGERIINELFELGAYIEDGKVVIDNFTPQTKNMLEHALQFIKNGDGSFVPIYGGPQAADNVLTNLNKQFFDVTGVDKAFKWMKKGDQYFLTLDTIDFDTFRKALQNGQFGNLTVNLGRKQLSTEYLDFYRNNADLVDEYMGLSDDIFSIFRKELGPENLPEFFQTTKGYSRHVLSEAGIDYLKANKPLARSKFIREGVDLLQQRTYLGTAEDVNKGLRAYYNLDVDLFDTNITKSLADLLRVGVTKNESHRVLSTILNQADEAGKPLFEVVDNTLGASLGPRYNYIEDFSSEFGKLFENLTPESKRVLTDYLARAGFEKGKKAVAIHKSAYEVLKRFEKAYVEVPQWLKGYDKMMSYWKGFTLFTPGFHINNFAGNMTNSYVAGMGFFDQSKYLPLSLTDLGKYDTLIDQVETGLRVSGRSMDDVVRTLSQADQDSFYRLFAFYNDGVSMKMAGVRDLEPLRRTMEQGRATKLTQKAMQANFQLAENADDLQRYALYQWAYDKEFARLTRTAANLTDDAMRLKARNFANKKTMETLFDYSNFTSFERDIMKRMVPFYTFMKNNLVFQFQNIARNPGQYAKLGRAYDYYINDIAGLEDKDMPEYARDNMWIPLPMRVMKGDKESISFLKTNLPPGDFANFVERPFNRGVNSLAMPIKLPIELGMGRDTFTGQPIKDFPGQLSRMEPDTGVLPFARDEQGTFSLSGDPIAQKIMNDLGLRVPARYATMALGIADTAFGYKDPVEGFLDALQQLNITNIKPIEEVNVIQLYQDLERLRNARSRFEQDTRDKLPTKSDLGLR